MKIIFIGAVKSSYVMLKSMLEQNIKIEQVFTIFDNQYNSDYEDLRPLCKKYRVSIKGISNINDLENIEIMRKIKPDFIFVIGFSQLIREGILKIPKYGCIGFHPSLLPLNRGRAVIPWTILNGLKKSGFTLFKIDTGTDTGEIIYQKEITLAERETSYSFYCKLMDELKYFTDTNIKSILNKELNLIKQDEKKATYCAIRMEEDGKINWKKSAEDIDRLIRATTKPYPGAFTFHKGKKLIIWDSEIIEVDNWSALPGQRVEIIKGIGVKVKTGKGIILIKNITYDNEYMNASKLFKIVGKRFD